jgi:hypothetical protein
MKTNHHHSILKKLLKHRKVIRPYPFSQKNEPEWQIQGDEPDPPRSWQGTWTEKPPYGKEKDPSGRTHNPGSLTCNKDDLHFKGHQK